MKPSKVLQNWGGFNIKTTNNHSTKHIGVEQDSNYAVGSNPFCPTKISLNHVGFTPQSHKACVIIAPPAPEFIVQMAGTDCKSREVFRGALRDGGTEIGPGQVGDFSQVAAEGVYQIFCGPCYSRRFVIARKVYDVPMRLLLNYFQMQKCGNSATGWAGPCHLDDGRLVETGEQRDFSGGYHCSCDLRKWAAGLNLGGIGLAQFGLRYSAHWDTGAVAEEIRWGSDYYHKIIRDDGGIFDSVWTPIGWGARDYYQNDAPAPAHWNSVRQQALTALYFQERDPAYARKCIDLALRVWRYMTRPDRSIKPYRAAALPPRGHDHWNENFAGFTPGSALDIAHRLCASADLYRATDDKAFLEDVGTCATALVKLQVAAEKDAGAEPGGGCFRERPGSMRLADIYTYSWSTSGPGGLCDALELAPRHPDAVRWQEAVRRIAEQCRWVADRNPYGRVPGRWCDPRDADGLAQRGQLFLDCELWPYRGIDKNGHSAGKDKPLYYYYPYAYNLEIIALAGFLRRASVIFCEPAYAAIAQRQIDWVLGNNPFDVSSVEGVGYNQREHARPGEHLPPTPQIPGAVNTGSDTEYDIPPTGWLLGLVAGL